MIKEFHLSPKFGYILLAIAMSLGLFFQQKNFEKDLKKSIQNANYSYCINSIDAVDKFNDLVYSLIETREEALRDSVKIKNENLTLVNENAIKRYKKQIIQNKTAEECKISIIP